MKIDKKTIDMLLKMNDDQLWQVMKHVAKRSGQDSFLNMEKPTDMSKIRNTLASLTDEQISSIVEGFNKERGKK